VHLRRLIPKAAIKKALDGVGLTITRSSNAPERTLLGLARLTVRTIIDVGANEGQFARRMLKVFPNATIYCFEPLPAPFRVLEQWSKGLQRGRVIPINRAIGDRSGQITMKCHDRHSPSSSVLKTTPVALQLYPRLSAQTDIVVTQSTMDESLDVLSISNDVLIKMDVQGYEDRVVAGGAQTFSRAIACITEVTLDQLYEDQAEFVRLIGALSEHGYRYAGNLLQSYAADGHCVFVDALFVRRGVFEKHDT
jgi:FkbM family methyltransferase